MNSMNAIEHNIIEALQNFDCEGTLLRETTIKFLNTLGYHSTRTSTETRDRRLRETLESEVEASGILSDQRDISDWQAFHILFQITDDEVNSQRTIFENTEIDLDLMDSYVFAVLELSGETYPRTQLANITRFINKKIEQPIMVVFRYGDVLSLGIINRRWNRRDPSKQVLEQVTLIKDINLNRSHAAHRKILAELSLEKLIETKSVHNFDTLHKAWADVLNMEPLNRKFYSELFDWYQWAVAECRFPDNNEKLEVIRLITRLLFIWFLKEKDLDKENKLVSPDLFDKDKVKVYLNRFDLETSDYYQAVLQNLFFATLSTPTDERCFGTEASTYHYADLLTNPHTFLEDLKQVPFVNGGLFDCHVTQECFTDEVNERQNLHVPAKFFFDDKKGIFSIFDRYKFTIEEHTPIEQEVALDPELLGLVFEHLLAEINPETREKAETARKETGSYYTPRAVVDYMVEKALIEVLAQQVSPSEAETELWKDQLSYLFNYAQMCDDASEWFDEKETDSIIRAIAELKILDPAVGSGAFPMGVLHKLTLALRRLDPKDTGWERLQKERALKRAEEAFDTPSQEEREAKLTEISNIFQRYRDSDFGRKLFLIQNSIFGVDIQPIACQIAKLRFFISLIIEQNPEKRSENHGIRPLPNLETRFITADTLIGLKKQRMLTSKEVARLELGLRDNSEQHFHAATRERKDECEQKDETLRKELASELKHLSMPADDAEKIAHWNRYDQNASSDWFNPEWMFGITDGFDVVIGNPPYAKSERVPESRSEQLSAYYGWGGDLYDYFIFAGFDLVTEQGIFTYIANDSYVTFSTKRKIRDLFLQNRLLHLVKAPANTFEASIYTAIFMLLKGEVDNSHFYMSGEMNFPDFHYHSNGAVKYSTIRKIPDCKFLLSGKNDWVLRLDAHENVEKYCDVLDTGIHSGNVRTKIFFKEGNGSRHRLLQGRQIQKYSLQWDSPAAQYMFCDIDYKPLPIPGIGRGGRPSPKDEYWDFCGDIENHHQPERLLMRQSDDDLILAYHSEAESGRFYTDNTLFTILPKTQKTNLKYFLALLNSRLLNFIYHAISQEQGKSQAQVKVKVVRKLPIVVPSEDEQRPVIALVDEILEAKASDPEACTADKEKQIDNLIYSLYNLTCDEIKIVKEAEE